MKLKRFFSFLLFAAVITAFTACDEDEDTSVPVDVTLNFTAPSDTITSFTWAEGKATFTDLNRGKEYELDLSQSSVITLSSGLYKITVEGAIASTSGEILCNVRSTKDNVQISAPSTSIALELSIYTPSNSLILKEIYVTGTANDKGTNSLYDKYFVIYNNSSETVYADGVALLESTFGTTEKHQYNDNPQPMTTTFTAAAIYVIPGNPTEHTHAPVEQLDLADHGYDFTQTKADAIDLSIADFEWYDETEKGMDPDIAEVPNLDKWYSYSATIWMPNNQANRAYAIARMGVSKDEFLANYYKEYHYTATNGKEMTKKGYDVPVAWVLEAVMVGNTGFERIAAAAGLDRSYATTGIAGTDKTRFGRSFIRKVASSTGSYTVYQDTDDSANDFTFTTPSLKK